MMPKSFVHAKRQVREGFRSDPRYIIVKREDREGLFNSYIAELVSVEQEAERAAKAKRDEEVLENPADFKRRNSNRKLY